MGFADVQWTCLRWTWRTGKSALMVDLVHVDDILRLLLDLSHIQRPGRAVLNIVDNVGKQISLYYIKPDLNTLHALFLDNEM